MEAIPDEGMPRVRDYAADLLRHYHANSISIPRQMELRLQAIPPFTREQLYFLRDLVAAAELEQIEPTTYNQEGFIKMAEQLGHKQGYIYALSYLIDNIEEHLHE